MARDAVRRACALAGAVFVIAPALLAGVQHGQRPASVDAVLDAYVRSSGGAARWRALRSLVVEGDSQERTPLKRADMVSYRYLAPGSQQFVQKLPPVFATGPMVITITPAQNWDRGAGADTSARGALTARRLLPWSLGVLPARALEAGWVRASMAPEQNDPATVQLDLADQSGTVGRLAFSVTTHLPATMTLFGTGPRMPRETVIEFGDFRVVDGLTVPFRITTRGGQRTITVRRYVFNPQVPPALFRPPATSREMDSILAYSPALRR